jgi:hypothetical protein
MNLAYGAFEKFTVSEVLALIACTLSSEYFSLDADIFIYKKL